MGLIFSQAHLSECFQRGWHTRVCRRLTVKGMESGHAVQIIFLVMVGNHVRRGSVQTRVCHGYLLLCAYAYRCLAATTACEHT